MQYVQWFWLRQIQRNVSNDVFEELVNKMFEDSDAELRSQNPNR